MAEDCSAGLTVLSPNKGCWERGYGADILQETDGSKAAGFHDIQSLHS